jgi:hypothetical protein
VLKSRATHRDARVVERKYGRRKAAQASSSQAFSDRHTSIAKGLPPGEVAGFGDRFEGGARGQQALDCTGCCARRLADAEKLGCRRHSMRSA